MKILLANPATRESVSRKKERYFIKAGSRWPWSFLKDKNEKLSGCSFPFFLAYSAGLLREAGFIAHVIDGVAMDMKELEFLGHVKRIEPELIVIESATHAIHHDLALCEKIKRLIPNTRILLCGAHATVFADDLLANNEHIDFIATGEYEFTLLRLAERIHAGSEDYKIEGLGYRTEDKTWLSDRKGSIKDIDTLPYPAFDLFPSNDTPDLSVYGDGICTYSPAVTLHSSRGCPFRCDFCMWNQIIYDNGPYRTFSPERVVDEMEYVIHHYGAKEIYFDDDDFCVSKKHVLGICNEIRKRELSVTWSCMGDAMSVDEEMIMEMADSGCIFMKFGVESGSKTILKRIEKPLDPDKAIKVSKWCRKYGIMTHATFTFGLDGETQGTMRETLRLANRIKFDTAQASITTPFPGTRYYKKLIKKGFLKNLEWNSFDGTMSCTFNTDHLRSEDVERFRKKAIKSMIFHKLVDPVWILRFLKRNYLLLKFQGYRPVMAPLKAFLSL